MFDLKEFHIMPVARISRSFLIKNQKGGTMSRNKRSSKRSVWITLAFFALVMILYVVQLNWNSTPAPTPTDTPTVLSGQATPTVEIGHPIKTTGCKSDGVLPDRECTPGAIDPNVTQQMVNGTICIVGYSSDVRPDTSVTNKIKIAQFAAYGIDNKPMSDYELDHLISLELGGCPDCVANLWPEPYNNPTGAREKDKVENYLHKAVCNGEMTLAEAQWEIATDWTAVYYKIYGK